MSRDDATRAFIATAIFATLGLSSCATTPLSCAEARSFADWHRRFNDPELLQRATRDQAQWACGTWNPTR